MFLTLSAVTLLALAATPAEALTAVPVSMLVPKASAMAEGRRVLPPLGAIEFCARHPGECARRGGDDEFRLTSNRWTDLVAVNARVNRSIQASRDPMRHGRADVWTLGAARGDCEDYALQKRHELIAGGWPAASVLLAIVRSRRGVGHAVAVARTDRGDFVLDNLTNEILPWDRTGLTWIKRQSWRHPEVWVRVERPAPPPPARKPVLELAMSADVWL
jgi:predicted transglutaminase-like cysteine proteinase